MTTYRRPDTGYEETTGAIDVVVTLFLGPLYYAIKGSIGAALAYAALIAAAWNMPQPLGLVWVAAVHMTFAAIAPYLLGVALQRQGMQKL